ncbi:hypothetical protein LSTR_LSTR009337 [Laodelphax striatellus]|uniref:Uncharacterized protein n=1 Tax=Laodelphax striatellus TaxID=195883 RepID=A0A482XHR8_LAOST|nr:hypothetical protein LSTR_LSTR009337 [Laodelphax striatellus]
MLPLECAGIAEQAPGQNERGLVDRRPPPPRHGEPAIAARQSRHMGENPFGFELSVLELASAVSPRSASIVPTFDNDVRENILPRVIIHQCSLLTV